MYTVEETLNQIDGDWSKFIGEWKVEDRHAIIWSEEVENKHGSEPWRTAYAVRYWENGEWVDTRFFNEEDYAHEFARDFVNGPHRLPYPTD